MDMYELHVWSAAAVCEVLSCERESVNSRERYAVAIRKNQLPTIYRGGCRLFAHCF